MSLCSVVSAVSRSVYEKSQVKKRGRKFSILELSPYASKDKAKSSFSLAVVGQ